MLISINKDWSIDESWLKTETKGLNKAEQDQNKPTRDYQANSLKMDPNQYVDCANKEQNQLIH